MMTKKLFATCLWISSLALAACQSEVPAPEQQPPSAEAEEKAAEALPTITTAVPEHAQGAAGMESIPVEEDFVEEVEQNITATNLEHQLEQLEKELAADTP